MASSRAKRGAAAKCLDLLERLRPILRAPVEPERILRSVANLLAVEIGQYCILDVVDERGAIERLDIEHADSSRRARLQVACQDAKFEPGGRVARLVSSGRSELTPRVEGARARAVADIRLLEGERVRSYVAAPISVNGATIAVLTLVVTSGTRRYDENDQGFLCAVADWTGLAIENALRRAAQPRASTPPRRTTSQVMPAGAVGEEAPTAVRRTNPLRRLR